MAVKFPQGTLISLVDVQPEDRIVLADFGGSQAEREAKFQQATAFQRAHKKKLEIEPTYDPKDPGGATSGIRLSANEIREAFAEIPLITIPESEDEPFVSQHLVIETFDVPTDETNDYYKELLKLSREFITGG